MNLSTGTLTASNLNDSQTSSSSSFSVGGTIGPAPSANFGISQSSSTRLGLTSSVVGSGTIRLTAPGADSSVLATLSRDPAGRQVVTVNTSDGFSINLSTQDFTNLANVATNATNFLNAITAAVPGEVSSLGPNGATAYRTLTAVGSTPSLAVETITQAEVQEALALESNWAAVVEHYG